LGEHLRKRRLEQGLYQQAASRQLRCSVECLIGWEKNRRAPEARYWPGIIAFLGYDPHPKPKTLGDRLRARYRALGLSRREASRRLGMDENTLQHYEEGTWEPTTRRAREIIEGFLRS
jgi:transcriptional regulator with XRE-family HTH domain